MAAGNRQVLPIADPTGPVAPEFLERAKGRPRIGPKEISRRRIASRTFAFTHASLTERARHDRLETTMTTIPNTAPPALTRPNQGAIAPQGAPQAATAAGQLSTLDPIKLLNRHKWLLGAAAVVGIGLGLAAHIVLKKVAPVWRPAALYSVLPPFDKASDSPFLAQNPEEMNRFMQTQTRLMTSDTVLIRVVEDPDLARNAKEWIKPFSGDGGMTINDKTGAVEKLKKVVGARVVPQTTLIELSATSKHKFDATAIVELVREKYEELLKRMSDDLMQSQINSMERQIASSNSEIERLQRTREELMRRENLDTIDDRATATLTSLSQTSAELITVTQSLQQVTTQREQIEADRNSPGGIPFSDGLRSEVERDPLILQAKGQLTAMEADRQALRNQGVSPEHRSFARIENGIRGQEQTIEELRQRLLRERFDGQLDSIIRVQGQLTAQRAQLAEQADGLQRRLTDLTRLISQLKDLDSQINEIVRGKGILQNELANLNGIKAIAQSQRVVLFQKETPPNQLAFPKLAFMIPAGLLVTVGLVGGFVLVREILDQRVKGPSDITIIPRTRLLGWIPLASEDPSGEGAVETAVRDRSTGIVAESGRQLRSAIEKRHGTSPQVILLVAGMPGSGATTVACNLGLAGAAADKRVLLLDANFRRPAMHKVFGLQESPGMADAISSQRSFEDCIQKTTSPNLDVMTCGSKELRRVERFGTNAMNDLIATARQHYDLILIDTAPAIVGGDYLVLSQRVDASILVVRAMGEKRGLVARVRNELGEVPSSTFLGVVVNAVRHAAGGYMKRNIRAAQEYQTTST
jgi:tyrosine-protein kinase Etk/Wzc